MPDELPYALVVQKRNERFVFAGCVVGIDNGAVGLTKAKLIVSSRYPADVVANGIGFSKIHPAYLSITKEIPQIDISEAKTIIFPDKKTQEMIEHHPDTGEEYFYEKEEKKVEKKVDKK